ncbi:MAG: glycosyltransferase family 1 protein [Candidatus Tectomicrobia bacterium]|uniref:Glycosyltransferase family 1 protein n=1 Tax=Tectimicrobiota bacterium TaxID=2528274 RepID=A0A937W008_UNCTE|nr:glycosyltransferase family 1 protein [Candidatus Tectomicrobia bacterium]
MKRVVLVTGHYLASKRKAGFHWLADAYWRAGWEVIFFTSAISWLSWLQRNYRMAYPILHEAKTLRWVQPRLGSYVWFTPWHPFKVPFPGGNQLLRPLFVRYGDLPLGEIDSLLPEVDLFIFESQPSLMLFERFRQRCPQARYVYRVSDDLRLLRSSHPVVLEAEARYAPRFDLISVPSMTLLQRFTHLPQAVLQHHGIRKDLFDRTYTNPYTGPWEAHLIFVGVSHFDHDFLEKASLLMPRWAFHIIGPIASLPQRENVIAYGEMPFEETVPFVKYADVGLATRSGSPLTASLTDSLKIIQYTYCRLPIVLPEHLASARPHTFPYRPGDTASIQAALLAAQRFDRSHIVTDDIYSWDELATKIAGD